MKILGFYKWKIHTNLRELPINEQLGQISVEENQFLKKKWLAYQNNLIAQRRYPYVINNNFFKFYIK